MVEQNENVVLFCHILEYTHHVIVGNFEYKVYLRVFHQMHRSYDKQCYVNDSEGM